MAKITDIHGRPIHAMDLPIGTSSAGHTAPIEHQVRDYAAEHGLTIASPIIDGKLHRFATSDDARSERSGWYIIYPDNIPAGTIGDWRSGESHNWRADIGRDVSEHEMRIMRQRMLQAARARAEAETRRHAEAAEECQRIWDDAVAAGEHEYARVKGIYPHGARQLDSRLLVPVYDSAGGLISLQTIVTGGQKRFYSGGKTAGGRMVIPGDGQTVYIVEGWATGCSVHEATGATVVVAFNAGNLRRVAESIRSQYQQHSIIIAGDHDTSGVGQRKAHESGKSIAALSIVPEKPGDWNDVMLRGGAKEVRRQLGLTESDYLSSLSDYADRAISLAERRSSGAERPVPVPWDSYADALQGGIWPGMHMVAAGTGFGKTQFSLAIALHAAKQGTPVMLINMELDIEMLWLRIASTECGAIWSRYATGKASMDEIDRLRAVASRLRGLPIYAQEAEPGQFAPNNLVATIERLKSRHKSDNCLIIVDYLQLSGGAKRELRERIGDMAYSARSLARQHKISIMVISSVARDKYGIVADAAEASGVTIDDGKRVIMTPEPLIGVGKESGETEFAADTLTVLTKWPHKLDNGESLLLAAVPKIRYGPPSWSAMAFNGGRFAEYCVNSMQDMPGAEHMDASDEGTAEARILEAIGRLEGTVTSARKLRGCGVRNLNIKPTLDSLFEKKKIIFTEKGYFINPDYTDGQEEDEEEGRPDW